MAYANYEYYHDTYGGTVISASDSFTRPADDASRKIDKFTFNRFKNELVEDTNALEAVKQCCCRLADLFSEVNSYRKSMLMNNNHSGAVKSVSSGSESITYATTENCFYKMANDNIELDRICQSIIVEYLSEYSDKNDILVTYCGVI